MVVFSATGDADLSLGREGREGDGERWRWGEQERKMRIGLGKAGVSGETWKGR